MIIFQDCINYMLIHTVPHSEELPLALKAYASMFRPATKQIKTCHLKKLCSNNTSSVLDKNSS